MKAPKQKVDIEPVVDISPDQLEAALAVVCGSLAVQKVRISSRGVYRVTDEFSDQAIKGEGPALVLVVNERLFKLGW